MSANKITGRSAFLALLKDEDYASFGNPGTTELLIMDALSEHPDLNYLMSMQESLVVYMAEGYSRASGNCQHVMCMLPRVLEMRWERFTPQSLQIHLLSLQQVTRVRPWPYRTFII